MQFLFTDNCFVSLHYTPALYWFRRCLSVSVFGVVNYLVIYVFNRPRLFSAPPTLTRSQDGKRITISPPRDFAYNFAKRNVLFIRSTMELSKARSILTVKDLEIWHKYTEDGLVVFNPKFRECFLDGSGKRILNMEEFLLSLGESKTKILLFKSLNTEYRAHGSVARVSSVIFVSFDSGGQIFPFSLTYLDFV